MKRVIAVCAGLLMLVVPAAAESPTAVVEEVQGKVTGAEFMDYVTPKTVSKLKSCRREKISGLGTVIVGTDESFVQFADVKAEKAECDSAQSQATTKATSEVAATVLRSIAKSAPSTIKPQLTLYGTSPVVEAKGRGTLVVERLDVKGERQQIELNGSQAKGKFYDFARTNRALEPGGIYSASFGSAKIVFRIDP